MDTTHDSGYKLLFSHAVMVRDLLRGCVPGDWLDALHFETLEKVNGSYISDDLRQRDDDRIWRVRWGDEWLYVYLLLEFQSTVDPWMAVRVQTYVGLLYQDLIRTGQLTAQRQLPPVLPLVLYNGERLWTVALEVGELIAFGPMRLDAYRPQQRYFLVDEVRWAEQSSTSSANLSAALFRLEASRGPSEVLELIGALAEWLRAPEQAGLRRAFVVWLKRVFLPRRLPGVDFAALNELKRCKRCYQNGSKVGKSNGSARTTKRLPEGYATRHRARFRARSRTRYAASASASCRTGYIHALPWPTIYNFRIGPSARWMRLPWRWCLIDPARANRCPRLPVESALTAVLGSENRG